jgi:hypothetical protein
MTSSLRRPAVLAFVTVGYAVVAIPSALAQVQNYPQRYGLSGGHTYVVHGTKHADGSCAFPGPQPGTSSQAAPLVLAPGHSAVEARQLSTDISNCTTTMEQGTPPASAVGSPPANGEQSTSGTAAHATASGQLGSAARARRHGSRPRAAAADSYAQGYVTTFFEDPAGIDVNKVNDGIGYYYNGTCVTYRNFQSYHYYWYTPSGWGKNADNWATSNTCILEASSSYVLFENDIFCFPNSCFTHYNRTSIHGHRDGYLYGFWNSWCDGDPRCGLLSFHAQLIRQA